MNTVPLLRSVSCMYRTNEIIKSFNFTVITDEEGGRADPPRLVLGWSAYTSMFLGAMQKAWQFKHQDGALAEEE